MKTRRVFVGLLCLLSALAPALGQQPKPSGACVGGSCSVDPDFSSCQHVIVGAGWGGSYSAWRTTVDTLSNGNTLLPADKLCIFEATNRIGGRAYSHSNITGFNDPNIRIDFGAYRWCTHSHPLTHHVFASVLQLPMRCYDPDEGTCNLSGNLTTVSDAYGNNAGYSSGPEGLIRLAQAKGARIFFNHRLVSITQSHDKTKNISLTFLNGVVVNCTTLILNIPAPSVRHLNPNSLLFTHTGEEAKAAILAPVEQPGAKQFLIYPRAPWRIVKELRVGTFTNASSVPPLLGRLHDFTGKCPTGAEIDNGASCWGAVMTYYDFNLDVVKYFATFQNSTSDPYTYLPYDPKGNATINNMILSAHNSFMLVLQNLVSANNLTDAYGLPFNVSSIGLPSGSVISVWWGRDFESAVRPSYSTLSTLTVGGKKVLSDPEHRIRNRVTKPLDDYRVFLVDESYSTGEGWGHPSLVMAERVLFQHFGGIKPSWVGGSGCPTNCLYNSTFNPNCTDCVSDTWWNQEITINPLMKPFIADCRANETELVEVSEGKCKVIRKQLQATPNTSCKRSIDLTRGGELTWWWVNSTDIEVMFQLKSRGWAGLGFGSMAQGDLVIARRLPGNKVEVAHYNSTGHYAPGKANASLEYIYDLSANVSADNMVTVRFRRPAVHRSAIVNVSNVNDTAVIYAVYDELLFFPSEFPQHTSMFSLSASMGCGYKALLAFEEDILPMFRKKDIDAMLFVLDMSNYTQFTAGNFSQMVATRLEDKTIFGLQTGMPKDITWPLWQIQQLRQWIDAGKLRNRTSNVCSVNPAPTFYGQIKGLFRLSDRTMMLGYGLDLWDYESVKKQAGAIYGRLIQTGPGGMPCDGQWPKENLTSFQQWMNCGLQQGDPTKGPTLSDREVYYRTINLEDNEDFRNQSKAALQHYLGMARLAGENGEPYQKFKRYDVDTFNKDMDNLYHMLAKQAEDYQPQNDPEFVTRQQVINRIIQFAPFNLIDGAWISRCCPTGPGDEVHSLLWGILNDEMGDGDTSKNHATLYQELLNSVGVFVSPVNSYSYAYDIRFLDSAFTQPAYIACLLQFSQEYFPELLGTTLQIEWSVLGIKPGSQLLKYWGINNHFYELHIGIDNAASGHGYRAKRAIELYLDQVRLTGGDDAVQAAWRRIWDGFLAFDALGSLDEDLRTLNAFALNTTAENELFQLMQNKSVYGGQNHNDKRVGKTHINELFGKPAVFINHLQNSAWVVAGNPSVSPIMNYLTAFEGPMFKVFTESELDIWRRWIESLRPWQKQSGEVDSYHAMRELVKRLGNTAMSAEHHQRRGLWGPNPQSVPGSHPDDIIEQPVATWLDISLENPERLMGALKHPKNGLIVCGNSSASLFITHVLKPGSIMGTQYLRVASDARSLFDGAATAQQAKLWTWKDIVAKWIDDGCPMKSLPGHTANLFPQPVPPLSQQTLAYSTDPHIRLAQLRKRRPPKPGKNFIH